MNKGFWLSLLVAAWAWAAHWAEHKNVEPDPARPLGWRFEVPSQWKQAFLAQFPYPLGEGWQGEDGSLQVCWLGNSTLVGQEQLNLENRGYVRGERRVAGRDAAVYERQNDVFCYLRTPHGQCRIHVTAAHPISQHILQSFSLIETARAEASEPVLYEGWKLQLPPGWKFQAPDLLLAGDDPAVRLSLHELPKGTMTRGWARSEAAQKNPNLKERLAMEPFSNRHGVDGYLVEWKGPGGSQLFAYSAQRGRGLKLELLRGSELERLRRLLSSLQAQP